MFTRYIYSYSITLPAQILSSCYVLTARSTGDYFVTFCCCRGSYYRAATCRDSLLRGSTVLFDQISISHNYCGCYIRCTGTKGMIIKLLRPIKGIAMRAIVGYIGEVFLPSKSCKQRKKFYYTPFSVFFQWLRISYSLFVMWNPHCYIWANGHILGSYHCAYGNFRR